MEKQMSTVVCPRCQDQEVWPLDVHQQIQGREYTCHHCRVPYTVPPAPAVLVLQPPVENRIEIACPTCDRQFRLTPAQHEEMAGEELICDGCDTGFDVPWAETAMVARPASRSLSRSQRKRQRTTPMKLSFPKGLGGVEADVSRGTANTVVKTMSGGLLVAIGIFLASMLGGKHKSS